jgi:membrane-bound serine protease (ClpP class)
MNGRLILAIISTLLEEVAIAVIVLLGLPRLGFYIPLPGLIAVMVLWLAYSVVIYRAGSRALRRKPVINIPVIGSKGKVVSPLAPEGLVKIKGELWVATSAGKKLGVGSEVIVEEQDGLRLVVRRSSPSNLEKTE